MMNKEALNWLRGWVTARGVALTEHGHIDKSVPRLTMFWDDNGYRHVVEFDSDGEVYLLKENDDVAVAKQIYTSTTFWDVEILNWLGDELDE